MRERESKRQKPAVNSARTSGAIRTELAPLPPLRAPPSSILSLLKGDGGVCREVWRAVFSVSQLKTGWFLGVAD
ncbi:hypothetical protein AEA09_18780 [Lysinibacillus contaminans]|uniref:Uncharacterized protein n=1 Tax=Lysinibacillus contaminans TaxID=1293441 RepID=A0ABR5JVU3_9BACI|nr:hypothetical protein AEA09_18780 [Lysinibacillus contaminans]